MLQRTSELADFCKHYNGPSGSIKTGEFPDWVTAGFSRATTTWSSVVQSLYLHWARESAAGIQMCYCIFNSSLQRVAVAERSWCFFVFA